MAVKVMVLKVVVLEVVMKTGVKVVVVKAVMAQKSKSHAVPVPVPSPSPSPIFRCPCLCSLPMPPPHIRSGLPRHRHGICKDRLVHHGPRYAAPVIVYIHGRHQMRRLWLVLVLRRLQLLVLLVLLRRHLRHELHVRMDVCHCQVIIPAWCRTHHRLCHGWCHERRHYALGRVRLWLLLELLLQLWWGLVEKGVFRKERRKRGEAALLLQHRLTVVCWRRG